MFLLEPLSDVGSIGITESGITNGMTATTFGPTAICNRAQIVTFLYRAFA